MTQDIHLDPKLVPADLRGEYTGRKFTAKVTTTTQIPADAGLWSGGSRDTFRFIRLADGKAIDAVKHNLAPWDGGRREIPVTLKPGFALVRHSWFCGQDSGLTFFVHPDDVTALLPAPVALTEHERFVLSATSEYKASYGGRNRYEMSTGLAKTYGRPHPSQAEWDAAKVALIAKGLLNKAGAITVAGRNAIKA